MRGRAMIVGGSLAGLFAAALLRRIGWEVVVYERAAGDLSGRGAGLGARSELFDLLRGAGAEFDDTICIKTRSRLALSKSGETICEVGISDTSTAWDRVYRALRAALPSHCYRPGMPLKHFEQNEKRVIATFADGSRAEADLLIGADGIRSTVRRQLLPGLTPHYAGYAAWRGLVNERDVPVRFRDTLAAHMTFGFLEEGMLMSVPVACMDGADQKRIQFSWFRPIDETKLKDDFVESDVSRRDFSIPPAAIRPERVTQMKADAQTLLAPAHAALVAECRQPLLQPIADLACPRIVSGRVALVGDAAFIARPHVGTGVTKAGMDAHTLATCLGNAQELAPALADYEAIRGQAGRDLVARGRYLGDYVVGAERSSPPDRFMQEFGASGALQPSTRQPPGGDRLASKI